MESIKGQTRAPIGFERFVAIGDSQTEGLHDYYDDQDEGSLRGWADRFAEQLAERSPGLLYANLAVRGKRTREIFETQVEPALALDPDLVSIMSGVNDMVRPSADPAAVAMDIERMYAALAKPGRTLLGCTFPLPRVGLTKRVAPRLRLLNAEIRRAAARHGVQLVDLEGESMASDLRLWSHDRIHLNGDGHARLAQAFVALVSPGGSEDWKIPLPPEPDSSRILSAASEAAWLGRYLLPKIVRLAQGRSSGDGRVAKRPKLLRVKESGSELSQPR
ncbi:MAG: SGNH/GDSL hydrolase family protein [Myxococcota bacterium]